MAALEVVTVDRIFNKQDHKATEKLLGVVVALFVCLFVCLFVLDGLFVCSFVYSISLSIGPVMLLRFVPPLNQTDDMLVPFNLCPP